MNTVVIFSFLNLWSMGKNKGAPSFHRTVLAYRDAGWNVILISASDPKLVEQEVEGIKAVQIHLGAGPLLKIRGFSYFARLYQTVFGGLRMYLKGRRYAKHADRTALLYAYEVQSVLPAKLLSMQFGIPLVTRFQGTTLGAVPYTLLERVRRYPHFNALATKSDLVIMTDDGTQGDQVLDRLGNHSHRAFWRNGVDPLHPDSSADLRKFSKESLGVDPSRILLTTVSRLVAWKHVERAIEAVSTLTTAGHSVSLLIVGDGPERKHLEELSHTRGISAYVHFVGSVPQSEVGSYLKITDIFLSLYDLSNLGNPLFEAMSSSKPIVTIDVGDTSQVIVDGENGVLLHNADIQTIVEGILRLVSDSRYAAMLGTNAKSFAESNFWTWNDRMDKETGIVGKLV